MDPRQETFEFRTSPARSASCGLQFTDNISSGHPTIPLPALVTIMCLHHDTHIGTWQSHPKHTRSDRDGDDSSGHGGKTRTLARSQERSFFPAPHPLRVVTSRHSGGAHTGPEATDQALPTEISCRCRPWLPRAALLLAQGSRESGEMGAEGVHLRLAAQSEETTD